MMYEPPARPVWKIVGDICLVNYVEFRYYFHWHFNAGKTTITEDQLAGDSQRFISPILFVDGHAASQDFTKALKTGPNIRSRRHRTGSGIRLLPIRRAVAGHSSLFEHAREKTIMG